MKKLLIILLAALLLVSFTSCNQDKIDELEKKVAEQENEKETLTKEKETLTKEKETLTKEKETLTKEKETLTEEKETLTEEKETLTEEKEAIVKNCEDFLDAFVVSNDLENAYECVLPDESKADIGTIKLEDVTDLSKFKEATNLLGRFVSVEYGEYIEIDNVTAKGNITGKNEYDSNDENLDRALTLTDNEIKYEYHIVNKSGDPVEGKENLSITLKINGSIVIKTDESAQTESIAANITINDTDTKKDTNFNLSCTVKSSTLEFIAARVNENNVEIRLLNAMFNTFYSLIG